MAKFNFLIICIVVLTATLFSAAQAADYTIADLKALADGKMWNELLEKAKTVRPSERNAEWKELVTKAANADLAAAKPNDKDPDAHVNSLLESYPFIAENAEVNAKISTIVINNLSTCLDGSDIGKCEPDFLSIVKKDKSLSALSLKGAKALAMKANRNQLAADFEVAATYDKAACKDSDLAITTIGGLQLETKSEFQKAAKRLATLCKDELKGQLETQYGKELKGSFYRQNSCDLLGKSCE